MLYLAEGVIAFAIIYLHLFCFVEPLVVFLRLLETSIFKSSGYKHQLAQIIELIVITIGITFKQ
jgi:hypothetical protein